MKVSSAGNLQGQTTYQLQDLGSKLHNHTVLGTSGPLLVSEQSGQGNSQHPGMSSNYLQNNIMRGAQ